MEETAQDRKDFQEWLAKNHDHFLTYSVDEIANLAIMAGFNRIIVSQWQTSESFKRAI
jgi:hypothetical protein